MKLEVLDGTIRFKCPYCGEVLERTVESLRSGIVRCCDATGKRFTIHFSLYYKEPPLDILNNPRVTMKDGKPISFKDLLELESKLGRGI